MVLKAVGRDAALLVTVPTASVGIRDPSASHGNPPIGGFSFLYQGNLRVLVAAILFQLRLYFL